LSTLRYQKNDGKSSIWLSDMTESERRLLFETLEKRVPALPPSSTP
jgi:hypothetical protein